MPTWLTLREADQRAGETTWTVLGTDNNSPYLDARAPLVVGQPEVRRYRGRYIVNDACPGLPGSRWGIIRR